MANYLYTLVLFFILSSQIWANDFNEVISKNYSTLDKSLLKSSNDNSIVDAGQKIYASVCFACHGKDLEGATGPNLRDGEWLHGSSPSEILKTIQKGFPDKGMVEFGKIYSEEQLKNVTAYILSKQQGLRQVEYKLYHQFDHKAVPEVLTNGTVKFMKSPIPNLESATPTKSGKLQNNLLDVYIAEVMVYAVEFDAYLLVPETGTYSFKFGARLMPSELTIGDKKVFTSTVPKPSFKKANKLKLKKGYHKVKASFFKLGGTKTPQLFFTWSGPNFEDQALSLTSKKKQGVEYIIDAQNRTKVYRVSMDNMPSGTMYVGHPQMVHFGFHPKTAQILGVWTGPYLDIGGPISNRSQDPAIAMGKWFFKSNPGIQLQVDGKTPDIKFIGYQVSQDHVDIEYTLDSNINVVLRGTVMNENSMSFHYKLSSTINNLSLTIPPAANMTSKQGQLSNNQLNINPAKSQDFHILVTNK